MSSDHLVREMEWFDSHRSELLKAHRGRWAVVHDQQLIDICDDYREAYRLGVMKTKSEKILVKQILEKDEPIEISVNLRLGLFHAPLAT